MAKINGLSVKGLKKFTGHEGECYQGNLYLGNKKIGFWSQDSYGGPDDVVLDAKYSERKLEKAVNTLNREKTKTIKVPSGEETVLEYGMGKLMHDWLVLSMDEKEYKKAVKAGYKGILILTDGYHVTTWRLPDRYASMNDETLKKEMQNEIKQAEGEMFKHSIKEVKIYRSPEDFMIGRDISTDDILIKEDE